MSGLPLPSQWVANPGNSELQVEDTVTVCVCVCTCVCAQLHSYVQLFEAPWTVTYYQAPVPTEFFKQEYWGGVPFLTPGTFQI